MTCGSLGFSWRTSRHHSLLYNITKIRRCSTAAVVSHGELVKEGHGPINSQRKAGTGDGNAPKWKKLNAEDVGIETSMITKPTRIVLNGLKKKGHQVYLVGGCVRDLILKRTPKDFDILTSAELKEVQKAFGHCLIVGKRFPICHVYVDDTIVEVSSFSTSSKKAGVTSKENFKKPPGCNERDYMRWRNCLSRDFTINGMILDPYAKLVYDYLGGIKDIREAKVRTVIPAKVSFVEDCARILRAVRIAARLGFQFTKDTAFSVKALSFSVLKLDKGRILMEMNYMLAFGSAEASLRLLWRFGILELLLPIQGAYFVSRGFRRRDTGSNMLLSLFHNLDRLVAPDRPCHTSLWIAIFAFHKALIDEPRDPLVVAAFTLAVQSGGSLSEAAEIAKKISQPYNTSFFELLDSSGTTASKYVLMNQVIDFASSVKAALCKMTDRYYVSQAMSQYPRAPSSDLVFISDAMSLSTWKIFQCVRKGKEKGRVPRRRHKMNYESLASGDLLQIQHTFARIVFDTIYPSTPDL